MQIIEKLDPRRAIRHLRSGGACQNAGHSGQQHRSGVAGNIFQQ
jgi:hypothetical protein